MVRIIISNKVCWGNAETDTAIAPVVVSTFTDLLLGTQLIKQRNWFISFYKITPATTAFISVPPSLPMSSRTWE